jgi:hypothetical protein
MPGVVPIPRHRLPVVLALWAIGIFSAAGCTGPDGEQPTASQSTFSSFALYALSRGKGVPDDARKALGEARAVLEDDRKGGAVMVIHEERIGIEGETRICVEYADPESARTAHQRISKLFEGTDLVNLVVEPCQRDTKRSPPSSRMEEAQ